MSDTSSTRISPATMTLPEHEERVEILLSLIFRQLTHKLIYEDMQLFEAIWTDLRRPKE